MTFRLSSHAQTIMRERQISEEWLNSTVDRPDRMIVGDDRSQHYFKSVKEHGGRILHVVVNPETVPPTIVTVFFDRRERAKK